jgi:hypothetical protein
MRKIKKGKFIPQNPQKYIGQNVPIYRSSWELTFMIMCDNNQNVLHWASEPFKIPYKNPITGRHTVYVPDFVIEYVDSKKRKHIELVEVKPKKETFKEAAKTQSDKARLLVNTYKWRAANAYAYKHGMKFRVITEEDIFVRN